MLRTFTTTALAALAISTAASAMEVTDFDLNNDNFVTIDELRTVFPGFSSADFRRIDSNDDRRLSSNEVQSSEGNSRIARYMATMSIADGLSSIDADGDRFASQGELAAVYTGLTDSDFRRIDTNRDGRVSAPELYRPLSQALVARYKMQSAPTVTIMEVDTNDDFFASFDELLASFPGLSRLDFEMIDLNGDNRVASTEFYNSDNQAILNRN